jgi:hypothetical protein
MDKTIRRNQICVIGLPRCDFVFSSTRSCFIAYGFRDSGLELDILKRVLEDRGIQPIEAGGALAPGQSAFCANADFARLAEDAIDQAIRETQQDAPALFPPDQILQAFLLNKKALVTPLNNQGEQDLFRLGSHVGFSLLNDFAGWNYTYFGNFTALRSEIVIWRIKMLIEIIDGRRSTVQQRVELGLATELQARAALEVFSRVTIWVVVNWDREKQSVALALADTQYPVEVFSIDNVRLELENLGTPATQNPPSISPADPS